MLEAQALRRRCEDRLRQITIPEPYSLDAFCESIAATRGRKIHRLPMNGGGGPIVGLWIATEDQDRIWYEANTSPLHQQHIVFHELSHLLCGHSPGIAPEHLQESFPDLSPAMLQRVLGRSTYDQADEQEAEMLATVIFERVRQIQSRSLSGVGELASRLESSLGDLV